MEKQQNLIFSNAADCNITTRFRLLYEFETLLVALIAACFSVIGTLYFLVKAALRWFKEAKFKVRFPDGSSKLDARIGEERTICIDIENCGRKASKIDTIFFYFPEDFEVKAIQCSGFKNERLGKLVEAGGIYRGYRYLPANALKIFKDGTYFSPKENLKVYFDIRFPNKGESYTLFVVVYPVDTASKVLNLEVVVA